MVQTVKTIHCSQTYPCCNVTLHACHHHCAAVMSRLWAKASVCCFHVLRYLLPEGIIYNVYLIIPTVLMKKHCDV